MEHTVLQKVPMLWYPAVSDNMRKKALLFPMPNFVFSGKGQSLSDAETPVRNQGLIKRPYTAVI